MLTFPDALSQLAKERKVFVATLSRISCAVIVQVARDLVAKAGDVRPDAPRATRVNLRQASQDREEALSWVASPDRAHPFSLEQCCGHINDWLSMRESAYAIRPEDLREALLARPEAFLGIQSGEGDNIPEEEALAGVQGLGGGLGGGLELLHPTPRIWEMDEVDLPPRRRNAATCA